MRILNNPERPDRDIRICPRGSRALEEARSPDRISTPLKRYNNSDLFIPLSWDDALDEIAEKLMKIKAQYGSEAIMLLAGTGAIRGKVHSPINVSRRFFSLWGGVTDTEGYYSDTAADFAAKSVFGINGPGRDPETLRGSELVILWGANISELRFGAKLEPVLRSLKKAGVPFYVIDPRLTRTARVFAEGSSNTISDDESRWLAIKPGTDAALMAAVLFCWISDNRVDRYFINKYTDGFDELEDWITGRIDNIPKSAGWAEKITGISAAQIKVFAEAYGKARPAALIPGLSIQRTVGGEEAYRMAMALQAAGGNIGILGGSSGGCLWGSMPNPYIGTIGDIRDIVDGGGFCFGSTSVPLNYWQDAILGNPVNGQIHDIRGLYSVGNNYMLQSSQQAKTRAAFKKSILSVCHDLFMTGTALQSDSVLPVTHFLERNDVLTSSENYLYYSSRVLEPPGAAKDDYEIFRLLSRRFGFEKAFSRGRSSDDWLNALIADSDIPDPVKFISSGIYDGREHKRIRLEDFIRDPLRYPLKTPSGLINFRCSENNHYGYPEYPHFRGTSDSTRLQLICPHGFLRTNSQHSNLAWVKKKEFPLLHMNPDDAVVRGIHDGMTVFIENENGSLSLPVELTSEVRRGVVWALQGNWETDKSVNVLTSTDSTLPSHGSRTHTVLVDVFPN